MTTDAELLREYAEARNEGAFAEIVRRQVNLVYRSALRQLGGDAHAAAEATQEVFTLLARKADALARHPSLAGWLYTTTHFAVRRLRRDERRRQIREQEALIMHEMAKDETQAEWERLRPVLDEAMRGLGERDRDALLARFFENRSFGEMGRQLAVSEDAARMRVDRALEKLRGVLSRRGVTSTSAALGLLLANEAACAVPAGLAASVAGGAMAGAASAGGIGTLVAGTIMKAKVTLLAAGAAGLLGVGFYFSGHAATGARIAAETADQQQELARLRGENRVLEARNQRMTAALAPTGAATIAPPVDPIARLRALTDLIVDGTVGFDAIQWVHFASEADIFGLKPEDDVATRRSQALIGMFALTPAEVSVLRELGERIKGEIAREAIARSTVRRDGDRLTIDVRPGPGARAAYERLLAGMRQTLGEDRFGLARMIGWEASLEKQMNFIGLSAFTFTSAREAAADRPGGVVYRGRRRDALDRGTTYVSGGASLRDGLGPLRVLIPADF